MALLRLLAALGPGRGWEIAAATFDHRSRGAEGAADARFVADACRRLGIPCEVGTAHAAPRSEAEARAARRAFLESASLGAAAIFPADSRTD